MLVVVVEVGFGVGELEQSGPGTAKGPKVHAVSGRERVPCLY